MSGSTSLIRILLDQYFDCVVYTPSLGKNYNLAIKVALTVNQCSARGFLQRRNDYKLISDREAVFVPD